MRMATAMEATAQACSVRSRRPRGTRPMRLIAMTATRGPFLVRLSSATPTTTTATAASMRVCRSRCLPIRTAMGRETPPRACWRACRLLATSAMPTTDAQPSRRSRALPATSSMPMATRTDLLPCCCAQCLRRRDTRRRVGTATTPRWPSGPDPRRCAPRSAPTTTATATRMTCRCPAPSIAMQTGTGTAREVRRRDAPCRMGTQAPTGTAMTGTR